MDEEAFGRGLGVARGKQADLVAHARPSEVRDAHPRVDERAGEEDVEAFRAAIGFRTPVRLPENSWLPDSDRAALSWPGSG